MSEAETTEGPSVYRSVSLSLYGVLFFIIFVRLISASLLRRSMLALTYCIAALAVTVALTFNEPNVIANIQSSAC